jgi:small GTP-binding protein
MKVVLVGDRNVGKSCILSKFMQDSSGTSTPQAIGATVLTKIVTPPSGPVRLRLWPSDGKEKLRAFVPIFFHAAAVAIFVFDVTSKQTLDSLKNWARDIANRAPRNIKLVVIGNKSDLVDQRVVPRSAGEEAARRFHAVFYDETSARTGDRVDEVFLMIAELDPSSEDALSPLQPAQPQFGGCC